MDIKLKYLFKFLIIFAIIKFVYLLLSFVLPKKSQELMEYDDVKYFGYYKVSDMLGLTKSKIIKQQVIQKKKSLTANLIGVYVDGDNSVAIIKEKNKSYVLKINDKFKSYKLVEIKRDSVTFSKNHKLYEIVMQKVKMNYKLEETKFVKQQSLSSYEIKKTKINEYLEKPSLIWKQISIAPNFKNGQIYGFKVNKLKKGSLFEEIGLKRGDVIVSVNNQELKSNKDAFSIYNKIDDLNFLQIEVLRNGNTEEIMYEIK